MEKQAFIRVVTVGALSWEEKNPIGYVHYPINNLSKEENRELSTAKDKKPTTPKK